MLFSVITAALVAGPLPPCSVPELRQSPDYKWSVERIREIVDSAHLIVLAQAVAPDQVPIPRGDSTTWWPGVRFEILQTLRGPVPEKLVLLGDTVSTDDYNPEPVPYRIVRRSGQRGNCFAWEYRVGARYLLLLHQQRGALTARWWPLAPLNEQVRDEADPWVQWVRQRIGNADRNRRPPDES